MGGLKDFFSTRLKNKTIYLYIFLTFLLYFFTTPYTHKTIYIYILYRKMPVVD